MLQAISAAGEKPAETAAEEVDVDLGGIEEAAVPAGVFGETLAVLEAEKRGENVGALGLFKRRKQMEDDE